MNRQSGPALALLFALGATASFSASAADVAPAADAFLPDPVLRVAPSQQAMMEKISDKAMRMGISGSAVIACRVADSGELRDCQPAGESPSGYDFTRSLLKISTHVLVGMVSASGIPTPGRMVRLGMRLKITFSKPGGIARAAIDLVTAPADIAALGPVTATLLTDPVWKSRPADEDLWKYFPLRAYHEGINGVAVTSCLVSPAGWLVDCDVYGEDPKHEGFGTALAKLASRMQVDSVSSGGEPTAGRTIRIGAQFRHIALPKDFRPPYRPWGNSFADIASHELSIDLVTVQQ